MNYKQCWLGHVCICKECPTADAMFGIEYPWVSLPECGSCRYYSGECKDCYWRGADGCIINNKEWSDVNGF